MTRARRHILFSINFLFKSNFIFSLDIYKLSPNILLSCDTLSFGFSLLIIVIFTIIGPRSRSLYCTHPLSFWFWDERAISCHIVCIIILYGWFSCFSLGETWLMAINYFLMLYFIFFIESLLACTKCLFALRFIDNRLICRRNATYW